jgi:hypothetical protein
MEPSLAPQTHVFAPYNLYEFYCLIYFMPEK